MNHLDRFRRLAKRVEALVPEPMVAVRPRIRIPGAPPCVEALAIDAQRPRLYIPDLAEHVSIDERRPLASYREETH